MTCGVCLVPQVLQILDISIFNSIDDHTVGHILFDRHNFHFIDEFVHLLVQIVLALSGIEAKVS